MLGGVPNLNYCQIVGVWVFGGTSAKSIIRYLTHIFHPRLRLHENKQVHHMYFNRAVQFHTNQQAYLNQFLHAYKQAHLILNIFVLQFHVNEHAYSTFMQNSRTILFEQIDLFNN